VSQSVVAKYLRLTWEIKKVNFMAQMEYRMSFMLEVLVSMGVYASFALLWYLFFTKIPSVAGWTLRDQVTAISIAYFGDAIFSLVTCGMDELARMVAMGQLDNYLLLPNNVLWQVAISRTENYAFGSIIVSVANFSMFGDCTLPKFGLFLVMGFLSSMVMFNFVLITQSLGFWIGNFEAGADKIISVLYTLQTYPMKVAKGALRMIMIWIIPAYFTAMLPSQLVHEFSWWQLSWLIMYWAITFVIGVFLFYRGLQRYESTGLFQARI
jgi:ABC-2 type transport system permease protein